ncbi:biotin-dependent carboxyltransferase family protein [Virgibacillus flavescens]|uniref:5-oxoprolinase subunit C family protein n=1 Tax=Virgibacillus flavescens TaxID=1611422 RepID=UPI003D32CE32
MQNQEIFQVIKPGIRTTIQDIGRMGYQRYGVPVSGAMDTYALQAANILVGNKRAEAAIEVTLIGPELEAKAPVTISITGANLSPSINNHPIQTWKSYRMVEGDRLTFGKRESGMRAYIAVAGGLDVQEFFGSKSTDFNSRLGSELEESMMLHGKKTSARAGVSLGEVTIPNYSSEVEIGVIEGPHTQNFSTDVRRAFFETTFVIDANSNRMGYRLKSEKSFVPNQTEVWSDPVPFGGIQITGNGNPIILMADRQTTGGYPRIGTVMSVDLPKIAQLIPNGTLRFYPVSIEKAQAEATKSEANLHKLETFYHGITS